MSTIEIYHNPRCSKSRQTLELLQAQDVEPEVILYLKTPMHAEQIDALRHKLNLDTVRNMMRTKEAEYKTLNLAAITDNDALIAAIVEYPKLLERPIVVNGDQARIGRPPEAVLEIL